MKSSMAKEIGIGLEPWTLETLARLSTDDRLAVSVFRIELRHLESSEFRAQTPELMRVGLIRESM